MTRITSDFTRKSYMPQEFEHLLEKRVRKELRIHLKLDKTKSYWMLDDGSISTKLLVFYLGRIFAGTLSLAVVSQPIEHGIQLHSACLEEYISQRLEKIISNNNPEEILQPQFAPLRVLTRQEIIYQAQLLGITGNEPLPAHELIIFMQEQYPQTKTSMLKSFEALTHYPSSSQHSSD